MNILQGVIETIEQQKSLSLIRIRVQDKLLTSIVIDTPDSAPYLKEGNNVKAIFKETEVIMGKGITHNISLQNKFEGKVASIDSGNLLSRVTVNSSVGPIISIITNNAVSQLGLEVGSEATAMVKTNEILLSE